MCLTRRDYPVLADGLERLRRASGNSAKPLEAVRQDRVWAEPSSRVIPTGQTHDDTRGIT